MDAGLLPVKRLHDAKQRLADVLGDEGRLALSRALFADALDRCEATTFLRWSVITDDPEVRAAARDRGLHVVDDPGAGLNQALARGIASALRAGAESVTILPVDVPLATAEDVRDLVDTGATSDVVLATARSGGGTNALYLSPPDALEPRFGEGSLRAHAADAEAAKLRCSILNLPRLALDIDTMEDVEALLAEDSASGATTRVLRDLL
ncbi:MAG: 2-phospho-L-lactate guanylyltransferase [Actinomycetota bacterium]|nr:2-phospho-L-lactate guanylyltransferase [Actinomycetota bacterium]